MPRIKKYTDEDVIDAVTSSTSVRQVLSKLGLNETGGNYKSLKLLIRKLELNTSHFTGMGWNKGKSFGPKRPIDDYLSNIRGITSYKLKNRLIQEGIFQHRCYNCGLSEWLGEPIPIELHHINGNNLDNTLANLQILCPNCHSLTDNFAGKNKGKVNYEESPSPEICTRTPETGTRS